MTTDWLQLLDALRSGDPARQRDAFATILRDYQSLAVSLCRQVGRRDHEDVLQDVLVRLWEMVDAGAIENLRPDTAHAYFVTMIRNAIHDAGRAGVAERALTEALFQGLGDQSPDLEALMPWPLPRGRWASPAQFLETIRDHLGDEEWQILTIWANARHHQDTWTDKAREQGIPRSPGALRVKLSRIHEKIRRLAGIERERGGGVSEAN